MAVEELMGNLVEELFEKDGLLAGALSTFEHRAEQQEMASLVLRGLTEGKHVLVEAGTGVGKSLAYLGPAAIYSALMDKRVVISTNTINLQEQILNKDIPCLKRALEGRLDFKAALLKGRGNYLCLRRFRSEIEGRRHKTGLWQYTNEEDRILVELAGWLENPGAAGDRGQIPFDIPPGLWNLVCSDGEACVSKRCSEYDRCLFFRARREQDEADLLIVNHTLFFADLKVRFETEDWASVFPSYDAVVFDEAHHLEEVATRFLGASVSGHRFKRLFHDALRTIAHKDFQESTGDPGLYDKMKGFTEAALQEVEVFFRRLASWATRAAPGRRVFGQDMVKLRITAPVPVENTVAGYLSRFEDEIQAIYDMYDFTEEQHAELRSLLKRSRGLGRELKELIEACDPEDSAYWIEVNPQGEFAGVRLNSAPVGVSGILREHMFEKAGTVVLTSATLATGESFEYITSTLGVTDHLSALLGSPFDYGKQALLCVPSGGVDPRHQGFEEWVSGILPRILDASKGRAFVLFTSYRSMRAVYGELATHLREQGFTPMMQGESSRDRLLAEFRGSPGPVLFGVASFWEGVDVQGEALSCVVLVKLPFEVPDEPVVQAKMERLEREGKNPFWHYSLPKAALKLKQGFGRLIRSKTDSGAVVILDHRLSTAPYARFLLSSLPRVRVTGDLGEISKILAGDVKAQR